nr:MAG TPA: hypothetical protein [Caudoviricetes sp.]
MTPCRFGPILIYRKEGRRARFVDNSIALISQGFALGRLGAGRACGVAPPPPAPHSVATDFLRRQNRLSSL